MRADQTVRTTRTAGARGARRVVPDRRWLPLRVRELVELVNRGYTFGQAAWQVGLSYSGAKGMCQGYGLRVSYLSYCLRCGARLRAGRAAPMHLCAVWECQLFRRWVTRARADGTYHWPPPAGYGVPEKRPDPYAWVPTAREGREIAQSFLDKMKGGGSV